MTLILFFSHLGGLDFAPGASSIRSSVLRQSPGACLVFVIGVQQPDKPLSGSQTPLSGTQHRRGRASGSSTHGRVCGDQQTLRGRAEDHRPERGAVKITGLQGWHSRSERQNRCNTDQRPEVGAIRIMSAGTGAIRITSAEIGAIDIMKPSRAQSRALDRSLMRVLSLMRLSLGGGAGLAIGAARALGAAEDGSRDGGRSIRRRPRAQRAPCLP